MAVGACSLTVPSAAEDGVLRCGSARDCPKSDDNRFTYGCKRGDGQSETSQQVCDPKLETVQCDFAATPVDKAAMTPPDKGEAYLAYLAGRAQALGKDLDKLCPADKLGTLGCPPKDGACSAGQVVKVGELSFCSDPKKLSIPAGGKLADRDVRDQFCRWYFCDESFVCDGSVCSPCKPGEKYEDGGCRTMHRNGEPSKVALPLNKKTCNGGESEIGDIKADQKIFGSLD